jgi:hypothetical protein
LGRGEYAKANHGVSNLADAAAVVGATAAVYEATKKAVKTVKNAPLPGAQSI